MIYLQTINLTIAVAMTIISVSQVVGCIYHKDSKNLKKAVDKIWGAAAFWGLFYLTCNI